MRSPFSTSNQAPSPAHTLRVRCHGARFLEHAGLTHAILLAVFGVFEGSDQNGVTAEEDARGQGHDAVVELLETARCANGWWASDRSGLVGEIHGKRLVCEKEAVLGLPCDAPAGIRRTQVGSPYTCCSPTCRRRRQPGYPLLAAHAARPWKLLSHGLRRWGASGPPARGPQAGHGSR
jgi:hypothetical protein